MPQFSANVSRGGTSAACDCAAWGRARQHAPWVGERRPRSSAPGCATHLGCCILAIEHSVAGRWGALLGRQHGIERARHKRPANRVVHARVVVFKVQALVQAVVGVPRHPRPRPATVAGEDERLHAAPGCWPSGNQQISKRACFQGRTFSATANVGSPTYKMAGGAVSVELLRLQARGSMHGARTTLPSRKGMSAFGIQGLVHGGSGSTSLRPSMPASLSICGEKQTRALVAQACCLLACLPLCP